MTARDGPIGTQRGSVSHSWLSSSNIQPSVPHTLSTFYASVWTEPLCFQALSINAIFLKRSGNSIKPEIPSAYLHLVWPAVKRVAENLHKHTELNCMSQVFTCKRRYSDLEEDNTEKNQFSTIVFC